MASSHLFAFVVLFLQLCICLPSSPGFNTAVSQSGLDYLSSVGVELLQQQLQTVQVADQSGDASTPIGSVSWTLTNIKVSSASIGGSSIALNPGAGLTLTLTNINVDMDSNWSYREDGWPHVSDSGSAVVEVESTTVSVSLVITASAGRPYLTVLSDSIDIGNLDIKLSGGASWLYNFFIGLLQSQIKSAIESALTQSITSAIDTNVNQALSTLPITQPINPQVEINYQLLYSPTFSSTYFSLAQLGEFYYTENPTECPSNYCPPNGALPAEINSEMVQMIVGDYVANSASYVFFNRGQLTMMVTASDVPANSPIRLNTTDWKYILPQLTDVFPDNLMELQLNATDVPETVFTSGGALLNAVGDLAFDVIMSDNSVRNAFTLRGSVSAIGQADLNGITLYGSLKYVNSTFTLLNSNIGDFDPSVLIKLVTLFLAEGVIPAVNVELATGIVLPTVQGVTFQQPSLQWGDGYLAVTTDIQYTPPM